MAKSQSGFSVASPHPAIVNGFLPAADMNSSTETPSALTPLQTRVARGFCHEEAAVGVVIDHTQRHQMMEGNIHWRARRADFFGEHRFGKPVIDGEIFAPCERKDFACNTGLQRGQGGRGFSGGIHVCHGQKAVHDRRVR